MSKKVLIVDNDFFFVEFLAELLEKRGYEVTKAYDGKEGISRLEEGPVDFLFLDIVIPKIDGKHLIEFTRMKFPDAHFPIIAVSGTVIERMDMLNEIGADYYITKGPVEKMADHINSFIDRIEEEPPPSAGENNLFELDKIFPRQPTAELIDTLSFQLGITESVGVGIVVVDRDARIIYTNPSARSIFDRSIENILNYHITDMFSGKDKGKLINALKRVAIDQELQSVRFSVIISSREIRIIVSLLKVEGEITGWIVALEEMAEPDNS